jgi:hypothetical protein
LFKYNRIVYRVDLVVHKLLQTRKPWWICWKSKENQTDIMEQFVHPQL